MNKLLKTDGLTGLCRERGISLVVLCGSQVRDSAKEGSDGDIGLVIPTCMV